MGERVLVVLDIEVELRKGSLRRKSFGGKIACVARRKAYRLGEMGL